VGVQGSFSRAKGALLQDDRELGDVEGIGRASLRDADSRGRLSPQ